MYKLDELVLCLNYNNKEQYEVKNQLPLKTSRFIEQMRNIPVSKDNTITSGQKEHRLKYTKKKAHTSAQHFRSHAPLVRTLDRTNAYPLRVTNIAYEQYMTVRGSTLKVPVQVKYFRLPLFPYP